MRIGFGCCEVFYRHAFCACGSYISYSCIEDLSLSEGCFFDSDGPVSSISSGDGVEDGKNVNTYSLKDLFSCGYFIRKRRRRVGRGHGCSKGKTCGRGHKGQKSRAGAGNRRFEGGQNPIYMRLPKRGFRTAKNRHTESVVLANLLRALSRVDPHEPAPDIIDRQFLVDIGLIKRSSVHVRIIGGSDVDNSSKLLGLIKGKLSPDFKLSSSTSDLLKAC